MHWLDSAPSREIDPVLDCLAFLARQADRPSSPVLLRAGLALSDTGTLPFHQVEPALDQVGMRGEPLVRRLKGWPVQKLPAILELDEHRAAVLIETKGGDGLIYGPGRFRRSRSDARTAVGAPLGRGQAQALVLVRGLEGPSGILAGDAGRPGREPAGACSASVHDERL